MRRGGIERSLMIPRHCIFSNCKEATVVDSFLKAAETTDRFVLFINEFYDIINTARYSFNIIVVTLKQVPSSVMC